MIVVITGGSGFIGKNLVLRHIEKGDEVRLICRNKPDFPADAVRWIKWDVDDCANIRSFVDGADVLYHCAAEVHDIARMPNVNVDLTKQLLAVVGDKVPHWIQLSSIGVYGKIRQGFVTENTSASPEGLYERTKLEADHHVINAAEAGMFQYTVLRPSNVFGEGMTNQSLYKLISLIDKGRFFYIGGKGVNVNYIHVTNVVDAMLLCAASKQALNKIYNLSDWCSIEIFIGYISEALGKSIPTARMPESLIRNASKLLTWCSVGRIRSDSAIDALTNRVIYLRERIESDLDYDLSVPIKQGVQRLVYEWKMSQGIK